MRDLGEPVASKNLKCTRDHGKEKGREYEIAVTSMSFPDGENNEISIGLFHFFFPVSNCLGRIAKF